MTSKRYNLMAATAFTLAITLSGCASGSGANNNRSLESVHQPIVGQSHYTLDLVTMDGTLNSSEQQRLLDWLGTMKLGYGDRISIDDPASYSNAAAHTAVKDVTAKSGMLVSDGAPITQGQIAPGSLRVIVTRTVAEVPGCPDWSSKTAASFSNTTSANYGCAVNSNIAAMVADPTDLIQGKSLSSQDPRSASKAIKAYRDAEPTGKQGLKQNTTQGGN